MPDGWKWGAQEGLPKFVIIKFPLVPVARVEKYIAMGVNRRRVWRLRWADMPLAARNRMMTVGELIIRARPEYTGPFDYTWAQVKAFFRNDETGLDETQDP